ncbi:ErfK/YbiS/YcfS/YnhG family protein [Gemmatirosa kalamazoonensis]|uniref:ErfK/YbiS/YcfS/YnhG family protein n=1 Tax=Gemmatirosa kalamazoonensis TaxID=861299 RepID=W0RQT7_9BACT|nr:ErfK/YbiS/YcfS/YnhG family protein [Gemmatirosa kalamazoonensis]
MRSTHLHAVRHGRSGDEPGRPDGGLRNGHVVAKGVSRLGAVSAWLLLACVGVSAPSLASAQAGAGRRPELVGARSETDSGDRAGVTSPAALVPVAARSFKSAADSLEYEAAKAAATNATGLRVIVSMFDRELYVLDGADTLLVAPVAVAVDTTLSYNGKSWRFETPRGKRKILSKESNPVWVPPEWHYAEVASRQGLRLAHLERGRAVTLADGRKLVVRGDRVGTLDGSTFTPLPSDEEIVFDGTIYVPPTGTANRRIEGELGKYKLSLGEGYLLHGTPHTESIGTAATHGCVRLLDEDVEWLYDQVPVGTPVYIY